MTGVPLIGAKPQPATDDNNKIEIAFDKNGAHISIGNASIDQIVMAAFHLNRVAGALLDNIAAQQQQASSQIAAIAANPKRTD